MATTVQAPATTPANRVPMTSTRKTALVAGICYLITFVSIPTLVLYGPVKNHRDWILSSGGHTPVLVGGMLEVIVALAGIGTAVTLYPVVKRQNEGAALGFAAARVLEAAMIITGVVSLLSLLTVRQDLGGTAGAAGRPDHHRRVARRGLQLDVPAFQPRCLGHRLAAAGLADAVRLGAHHPRSADLRSPADHRLAAARPAPALAASPAPGYPRWPWSSLGLARPGSSLPTTTAGDARTPPRPPPPRRLTAGLYGRAPRGGPGRCNPAVLPAPPGRRSRATGRWSLAPAPVTRWTDHDRGPQADAGERTRSAHRAIEIREKRRGVLSSRPV